MDAITGKTAKKQYALAAEAQALQRAEIDKREASVAAVEAGQKKLMAGGGGGLLAFVDKARLATTLGGAAA